jgi:hypothetical protein
MDRNSTRSAALKFGKPHFEAVEFNGVKMAMTAPSIKEQRRIMTKHFVFTAPGLPPQLPDPNGFGFDCLMAELRTLNDDGTPGELVLEETDREALLEAPVGEGIADKLAPDAMRVFNGAPAITQAKLDAAKNA